MPGFIRSLIDPLVLAAVIGLAGSIAVSLLTSDHTFDSDQSRCARAFAFLQDEAVNPMLEKDDVFIVRSLPSRSAVTWRRIDHASRQHRIDDYQRNGAHPADRASSANGRDSRDVVAVLRQRLVGSDPAYGCSRAIDCADGAQLMQAFKSLVELGRVA